MAKSPDRRPDPAPAARHEKPAAVAGPVWMRQAPPKPERLTLEAILRTAIALADTEGLDAVSVRRIAAALNARPMSLYTFVSSKDDLVELMVDEVMGEMLLDRIPDDWQEALRAIARHTRAVGVSHPWLITAISHRPPIGPNALRHMEQSLAAIASLGSDPARATSLLLAVDMLTIGYAALALAELQMRHRDGLTDAEWRASTESYFARLVGSESHPHLASLGNPAILRRSDDEAFEGGLNWLLSGFAATLDPVRRPDPQQ
jgi:AcrR family transcriptional regulator